jgi:DNA invertase Pin-like site-specific DNA recombinase
MAEFGQELIGERTQAGTAAARARGRHGGRPRVMSPDQVAAAHHMYESKEFPVEAIARVLGVSWASIYRHLAGAGTAGAELPPSSLPPPRERC